MKKFLYAAVCGCLVGLLALVASDIANAQAVSVSELHGTVTDAMGALVPNASVKATDTDTGATRTVVTNSQGQFNIPALPVGPYSLLVSAPGFKNYEQTGIVLQVGMSATVQAVLSVGESVDVVEVKSDAQMIETHNVAISTVIDNREINELPLDGRLATQLVLVSGASVDVTGCSGCDLTGSKQFFSSQAIAVAGSQGNSLNYMLDGAYHNDPFSNVNLPFPFPDALQEFSVQTSALPAQYGVQPGGAVNAVTKSGTNRFHGTAFEYWRNNVLNATTYFSQKDTLHRNQYGGTVGGPIRHDRIFFFAGYQGTHNVQESDSIKTRVITPRMKTGDWSIYESSLCTSNHTNRTLHDPDTKKNYPGNKIPVTAYNSSTLALLQYLPTPVDECGTVYYGILNNTNENQIIGRVDLNLTARQSMFVRYFIDDYQLPSTYDGKNILVTTQSGNYERAQALTIAHTFVINPRMLNSIHIGFSRRRDDRRPSDSGINGPAIGSKIYSAEKNSLRINVSGNFSTSCSACARGKFNDNIFMGSDDATYTRGRHQIDFGGSLMRIQLNQENNYLLDGYYIFAGNYTGDNMADFMLGRLSGFNQSAQQATANRQTLPGLYVQDTFRMTNHFTVIAGMRWEPHIFPVDYFGRGSMFSRSAFDNNIHSSVYVNAPAGSFYYGDPGIRKAFVKNEWMGFSPRLGIVISPSGGRDVFRSGFGLLYDNVEQYYDERVQSNPPFTNEIDNSNPGTFDDPWSKYPGGNPFPIQKPSSTVQFPTSAKYVVLPDTLKPTYIMQWNANYEHQFAKSWMMSLSYIGNKTTHIWAGRESNPAVYIPGTCGTTACSTINNTQSRRVLSLANPTQGAYYAGMAVPNDGANASYNGLLTSLQHRFSHNFSMRLNYTWSHCMSDSDFTIELTDPTYMNPDNLAQDHGNCNHDIRNIFNGNIIATSSYKHGGRTMRFLLTGWKIAPLVRIMSGSSINVKSGVDNSLRGYSSSLDRPNLINRNIVYNLNYRSDMVNHTYLNASAFAQNAAGTFGNVQRNGFKGPGYFDIDASAGRVFKITEGTSMEFRADAFNATNHANFGLPQSSLNVSTFGFITTAKSARVLQFSGKFRY